MYKLLFAAIAVVLGTLVVPRELDAASEPSARTPILVELFTSEGCSSCPPADTFLQKLDQQTVAGAEVIVLSEHVDYWNHIGWKDPYSASFYSDRQNAYGSRFRLSGVYTPQMVVDGAAQFVGSDQALGEAAIRKAENSPKIDVRLSAVSLPSPGELHAHVETAELVPSFGQGELDVYLAIALDHAESQVSGGENAGHKLAHTAVVRKIVKIGVLKQGRNFTQDVQVKMDSGMDPNNLRLIVFLQQSHQGKVFGVAMAPPTAGTQAQNRN